MQLIFVHGWSVTNTNTYGDLPKSLVREARRVGIQLDVRHIFLGKYISFHDEVTLDDVARALNNALEELPGNASGIQPFACITHSTGGPVVRYWVNKYYGARKLSALPLTHLVMLAPANHGSTLAKLGKERVGRIKAFFSGMEPGQGVLDWLALGSEGQWSLNEAYLSYRPAKYGFFPFVLTGQGVDTKFYDFLNHYLVESGSDGVVRVAGANMNFRYLTLNQTGDSWDSKGKQLKLEYNTRRPVRFPQKVALGAFSQHSHSGKKMGIMAIKKSAPGHANIIREIADCLAVNSATDYTRRSEELTALTTAEQQLRPEGKSEKISRYSMLVFRIRDQFENPIKAGNFEILLLAGKKYSPDKLPKGFFVDSQMNSLDNSLVYYVDADKMNEIKDGLFGVRVTARPEKGFSYYQQGEFRSEGVSVENVFVPNETTYIDITLKKLVDENVFRFSSANKGRENFKKMKPSGKTIPD